MRRTKGGGGRWGWLTAPFLRSSLRTRRVNVNKWIKARTFWTACSPRVVVGAWVAFQAEKQFPTAGADGWKKKKKKTVLGCRQVSDERDKPKNETFTLTFRCTGTKMEYIFRRSLYHRATSGHIWVLNHQTMNHTEFALARHHLHFAFSLFSLAVSEKSWKLTKWPRGDWAKLCISLCTPPVGGDQKMTKPQSSSQKKKKKLAYHLLPWYRSQSGTLRGDVRPGSERKRNVIVWRCCSEDTAWHL